LRTEIKDVGRREEENQQKQIISPTRVEDEKGKNPEKKRRGQEKAGEKKRGKKRGSILLGCEKRTENRKNPKGYGSKRRKKTRKREDQWRGRDVVGKRSLNARGHSESLPGEGSLKDGKEGGKKGRGFRKEKGEGPLV